MRELQAQKTKGELCAFIPLQDGCFTERAHLACCHSSALNRGVPASRHATQRFDLATLKHSGAGYLYEQARDMSLACAMLRGHARKNSPLVHMSNVDVLV